MKSAKYKEIEAKYNAANISLEDFREFANRSTPDSKGYYCGYDYFYSNPEESDSFVRHRVGENFNQLTFKRKLTEKNNFIMTENNITLGKDVSQAEVMALCESLGYTPNCSIFKNIYVYTYPRYVLAYYVVYGPNLKEMGRFMEIEAREDFEWKSEQEAWQQVMVIEVRAAALGIVPQGRIKKSLFEMFGE